MLIENGSPMILESSSMNRSKSATLLKMESMPISEEDLNALCQLIYISMALLESNIDNEFLLGLYLLDKVIFKFITIDLKD